MRLNVEEIVWGCTFGLFFYPWIGLKCLILAPMCGVLWALSGAGYPKILRRGLVPGLACIAVLGSTGNLMILLSWPLAFCVLSMGYGIPDAIPPYDKGSAIGRFWCMFIGRGLANIFTRGTIILLLLLSYFPLFI